MVFLQRYEAGGAKDFAKLSLHDAGVVAAHNKTDGGADVAENGLLNLQRYLGDVLVGQNQPQAEFAGFGKNFDKTGCGKILKLVNVKEKFTALAQRHVYPVHGCQLKLGNKHGSQKSGVVLAEFTLGEIGDKNFTGI